MVSVCCPGVRFVKSGVRTMSFGSVESRPYNRSGNIVSSSITIEMEFVGNTPEHSYTVSTVPFKLAPERISTT